MSTEFWNSGDVSQDVNSFTLESSIFSLLSTQADAKLCNYYQLADSIVVETKAEYLERMIAGSRPVGSQVTMLMPKDGYTPQHSYTLDAFNAALANFDIKYYAFVSGLADENFVEIDMGGGVTDVFVQEHGYIPRLLDLKYTRGGTDYHITTIKKLDGIIYGGKLIWLGGLSFFLQTTITAFFGNIYIASGIITHDAADGTYDRLDVVATTSENTVAIVKGTPSANPVKPVLAPGTHKEVTTILIKAGSTTLDGITGTVIYNENIEWTVSASGLTIDADSTVDPFIGDVCIDASGAGNGDEIIFTQAANENVADYSEITLQAKLKTAFTTKQYGIYVAFYQDTELVSNIVTLPLEALNTSWQNFVLNFSEFSFTGTTFNKIVVGFINSSGTDFPGFYLDYIVLQKGIIQPPVVDSHPPVTIAENSRQYLKIGPDQKLEIVVDELPVGTGADGKSAYEIAVLNGFEGTEAEWLESLKGEYGHTPYIVSGYWWINGVNTGIPATGANGRGISGVVLHSTVGKVKTYRMTLTDATTFDYTVTDGEDGTGGGGVKQITGLTILASGWVADGSLYKYELSNAAITADHICEIVPDDDAYDILVTAKPLAKTTSVAGTVTMKVHAIPASDFTVTLNLYTKTT